MILSLRGLGLSLAVVLIIGVAPFASAQQQQRQQNQQQQAEGEPVLLTPEQINLIRVWELPTDLNAARVTIRIPREVMLEIFDQFRDDPLVPKGVVEQRDFLRQPATAHLDLIFSLAPKHPAVRTYYKDVQVNGEPDALIEFRRQVYGNYVQRYFRRHFGDGQVPGLELVNAPGSGLAEMYTNFYILSVTEIDGRNMIDRRSPEDSLLLQWGLPREAAKTPAPDVPGWRPFFRSMDDPNYQRISDAIAQLYNHPGDYGIEYALPGAEGDEGAGGSGGGNTEGEQGRGTRSRD